MSAAAARCPKCDAATPAGAAACPACGLAAERFEAFAAEPPDAPPEVIAAWHALGGAWEDEAAHERFRSAAAAAGAFAFAARSYRQAARERAGEAGADPRAADGLARIQRMAEASLLVAPPAHARVEPGRGGYRNAVFFALTLILVAAIAGVGLLLLRRGGEPADPREGRARQPGRGGAASQPLRGRARAAQPAAPASSSAR